MSFSLYLGAQSMMLGLGGKVARALSTWLIHITGEELD
jgi:hypothetical protein